MNSKRAKVLPYIGAKDDIEHSEDYEHYRRGELIESELESLGEARLTIKDSETGNLYQVVVDTASSMLGRYKEYLDDEFTEQFGAESDKKNPGRYADEILSRLLVDTNKEEFKMPFYYDIEQAEEM